MRIPFLALSWLVIFSASTSFALPAAPTNPDHPGSKIYTLGFTQKDLTCLGRVVRTFVPNAKTAGESYPVVVYGKGQALDIEHYRETFEHLAKKGVIAIFPKYDTGFFDQNWTRMGRDYVNMTACALQQLGVIADADKVVFAGHSKGAYVASVAAGLSVKESLPIRPRALMTFAAAGSDQATLPFIERTTAVTVVFSDSDSIVSRDISNTIYSTVNSDRKQFILLKSYPQLKADHFWPLTKASSFGGGPEGPFQYYSHWKWLVAAAEDLKAGGRATHPFVYGPETTDKGVDGLEDEIQRNW